MSRPPQGPPAQDSYRVNRRIRVPEVRVILDDGTQLGVMPTYEALRTAEERGLDLVEVSPKAVPPVCRIMDYGKFKFEQAKKTRQAKKHASVIEIKEIKFRPKTDDHDLDFKMRHIRRFLEEGNKVRLVIAFRGREIVHPETGKAMLDYVVKQLSDIIHVEQIPMMDGKRMVMTVSPKPPRPGAAAGPGAAGVTPRPTGPVIPAPAGPQPSPAVRPATPGPGPSPAVAGRTPTRSGN
ncbi:MAG TPA: translation initiation factor IF-3 [Haliangiales bacterium]|nr:translation initiation factor IF-3 [Haliangiales bacterium]